MQERQEIQVQSPGQEDPMEEEMATLFTILACKIPWTREPGELQSMGSQSQTRLKRPSNVRFLPKVLLIAQPSESLL